MEAVAYTIVAVALYFVADRILNWLEIRAGKRFQYRSLIFFAILATLALVVFSIIRTLLS